MDSRGGEEFRFGGTVCRWLQVSFKPGDKWTRICPLLSQSLAPFKLILFEKHPWLSCQHSSPLRVNSLPNFTPSLSFSPYNTLSPFAWSASPHPLSYLCTTSSTHTASLSLLPPPLLYH